MTPEGFFAGHPHALATFREVCAIVGCQGPFEVRISKSQACRFHEGLVLTAL